LYALAQPLPRLEVEASATFTARPEVSDGVLGGDSQVLFSLRSMWQFSEVVGADVRLLRDALNTRLVTRVMLQLSERFWVSFGVGWDLDGSEGPYDGGGGSIYVDL
jgi:hypothetical protein